MEAWGFSYKSNLVWYKIRKDGGPDGRGVGFYFRNVTELVLFGVRGSKRTLPPGRTQVNILVTRKREHSRKPDEIYDIIESCSPGPYLEGSRGSAAKAGSSGATKTWKRTPCTALRAGKATSIRNYASSRHRAGMATRAEGNRWERADGFRVGYFLWVSGWQN